ncbi:uncharacterized protein BO66DRAFT_451079 [Aspergillus aculeatinus CBS 121060]|uniref:Uncharacterized protein n=1 Tax=Aspergillus aculeatinus CBS 121060 TaxID=1448322 RepID=A0ACD1H915_9EURO|nr:hypothetical protein BO66DRAFT_451079 [Aspergillus aculeatinus CBS 121060]RAH70250.1 hypothetical protein BO66DRAFT_451079 [Aspergillus aculeatinus CBS 121060]
MSTRIPTYSTGPIVLITLYMQPPLDFLVTTHHSPLTPHQQPGQQQRNRNTTTKPQHTYKIYAHHTPSATNTTKPKSTQRTHPSQPPQEGHGYQSPTSAASGSGREPGRRIPSRWGNWLDAALASSFTLHQLTGTVGPHLNCTHALNFEVPMTLTLPHLQQIKPLIPSSTTSTTALHCTTHVASRKTIEKTIAQPQPQSHSTPHTQPHQRSNTTQVQTHSRPSRGLTFSEIIHSHPFSYEYSTVQYYYMTSPTAYRLPPTIHYVLYYIAVREKCMSCLAEQDKYKYKYKYK